MTAVGDERELALTAGAAIPWEERPAGAGGVVWRSSRNPIIARDAIPRANSIFNSAVVPFGEAFAGSANQFLALIFATRPDRHS